MRVSKILRIAVSILLITGIARGYAADQSHVKAVDPVQATKTLQSSRINGHYWKYLRYYQSQITTKTCSLASAAMVMNTLDVEAPMVPEFYPRKFFTQKNFLNEKSSAIRSFRQVEVDGASLSDLAQMFSQGWGMAVTVHQGSDVNVKEFRHILIDSLSSESDRVIGLYKNDILDSNSQFGHFSPIAAYNEETDEVLIMDVAMHLAGPYWVGVERLHKATNTISKSGESRGLLIIREK